MTDQIYKYSNPAEAQRKAYKYLGKKNGKIRKEKIDTTDEMYISFSQYKEHLGELPFRDRMGNLIYIIIII